MAVEVMDHWARILDRLNAIVKRQALNDDGASGSAQTLAMRRGTTCDTCQYAYRMSFRHDKNDSGLMCLHDIRKFSSSRFPRDNAESA